MGSALDSEPQTATTHQDNRSTPPCSIAVLLKLLMNTGPMRQSIRALSIGLVIACTPSIGLAQARDTVRVLLDASLRPGDVLRVTVWENPKLSGDFDVGTDGSLKHPLYSEVQVVGVPLATVKERLATFLRQFQREPRLEIEPLLRVTVGGEVRSPNVYSVSPETTIADVIARAGGPTENGRMDQVTIVRTNQRAKVDLTKSASKIGAMTIRSGDQLIVGRRGVFMRDKVAPYASILSSVISIILLSRR